MEKSPKDKMIKTSPRKKTSKEIVARPIDEKKPEPTEDPKELKAVEAIIQNRNQVTTGTELFNKMTRPQVDLIKRTYAKGATDDELMLFLNVCVGANLNPFLRQVHFVKRWDSKAGKEVGAIQVGIDGFRAIAESGGQYAGSDDATHADEAEIEVADGKTTKKIKVPGKSTVTVHKLMEGNRYPFTATARWNEYYPGDKQGYMWKKMPYGQLAKCAEALALRKAFPKLLSGLYEPAEMDQAQTARPEESSEQKARKFIAAAKSVDDLNLAKEKLSTSEKYSDAQKIELQDAIDARINELQNANA